MPAGSRTPTRRRHSPYPSPSRSARRGPRAARPTSARARRFFLGGKARGQRAHLGHRLDFLHRRSAFRRNASLIKPEAPRLFKFFARRSHDSHQREYTKLKASYLFADIARRVNAYVAAIRRSPSSALASRRHRTAPAVCVERCTPRPTRWPSAKRSRATARSKATRFSATPSRNTTTPRAAARSKPTRFS